MTADEAREIVRKINQDLKDNCLKNAFASIKTASEFRQTEAYVDLIKDPVDITELENRGFILVHCPEYGWSSISW